jgi:RNA polymerase sigma factor (sigma-70 family)
MGKNGPRMPAVPLPAGRPPGSLSGLPDAELAALAGGGDAGAFETLYRRHRDGLIRYCDGIVRNRQDAEEAVQATMIRAHGALARGRRPAAVRAWLAAIARNECRDLLRARPRVEPLMPDLPGPGDEPEEGMARRQRLSALRDDLGALPHRQRAALVLSGVAGLPHAQVAELIGASPGETRTLVHEARQTLVEFEAGRDLRCADVRQRVDAGDGRMLRARRIGAHLRVCEGCRDYAEAARVPARRRGLAALIPPIPLLGALRALFGAGRAAVGSSQAVVAGTAGAGVAAIVATLALVGTGPPGGGPDAGSAAPAEAAAGQPTAFGTAAAPAGRGTPAAPRPRAAAPGGTAGAPKGAAPAPAGSAPPAQPAPASSPAGGAAAASTAPASAPRSAPPSSSGGPLIAVAPVTVPSVTVPSVSVLPVRVPAVTVPSVTVQLPTLPLVPNPPALQTPEVTTPPIELATPPLPLPLPEVALPEITVPEIPLPGVQLGGG